MKSLIISLLATFSMLPLFAASQTVTVTLLADESIGRPSFIVEAERNLGEVLTEINRAQAAGTILTTNSLHMDDFSLKSLLRIWAVTPFYCDDSEVVERVWIFRDGSMQVNHIPLIITPRDEDFGYGQYQEAVVEFDSKGVITDFRLAIDAQVSESMEDYGSVVEKERQMIILQYVERFRTAYNQKDIDYIEQLFSEDALIITGKVVRVKTSEMAPASTKVEYMKQNKQQYITNLKKVFLRNSWIDVKFSLIGEDDDSGAPGISRSLVNPSMYGVRLRQEYRSSTYSDQGYLFLLWEFPEDGGSPIIHVRTWQPEMVGGKKVKPDLEVSSLAGFDL